MRQLTIIAANFLRESRWPVVLLFLWITGGALLFRGSGAEKTSRDDVLFYLKQQALYVVVFSLFLAATALHNDRKSRRILLVLSKAVSRAQYLLALFAGTMLLALINTAALTAAGIWLAGHAGVSVAGIGQFAAIVLCAASVAASLSLALSTVLNPFVAAASAAAVMSLPAITNTGKQGWAVLVPGQQLVDSLLAFAFQADWSANGAAIVIAIAQSALFLLAGALVFARVDIAVASE